jgi:hypothetical protein
LSIGLPQCVERERQIFDRHGAFGLASDRIRRTASLQFFAFAKIAMISPMRCIKCTT